MTTLDHVCGFFKVDPTGIATGARRSPIEIPNAGRDQLAQLFHVAGFAKGAEIGVERGVFSETLLTANPGSALICVDPWQAYQGYREHVTQAKLDDFFATTRDRLRPYDVQFMRQFSVDAARHVADRSLDFVFIDGNHDLPHVIQDLVAWTPKVRKGGIVAGHDYCRRKQSGYQVHVVEAVHAWTSAYFIAPWFVLGRKAIVNGEVRDTPRSWFWVVA